VLSALCDAATIENGSNTPVLQMSLRLFSRTICHIAGSGVPRTTLRATTSGLFPEVGSTFAAAVIGLFKPNANQPRVLSERGTTTVSQTCVRISTTQIALGTALALQGQ